jgi:hypothetical protein
MWHLKEACRQPVGKHRYCSVVKSIWIQRNTKKVKLVIFVTCKYWDDLAWFKFLRKVLQ